MGRKNSKKKKEKHKHKESGAKLLKGKLDVSSGAGKGTSVHIEFNV